MNPIRAKICKTIEDYEHTSIDKRLQHLEKSPEQLQAFMQPLVSGIGKPSRPKPQLMTLEGYIHVGAYD
jgi:hypothetical protein